MKFSVQGLAQDFSIVSVVGGHGGSTLYKFSGCLNTTCIPVYIK